MQTQYRGLQPQIEAAVQRVLNSGQVILGPEVAALEEEVAGYCGVRYGVGCGSGTDALLLALRGLDIGPGDEVILPTFTFFATAGSVCRTGAQPVFCDIDPQTFNMDPLQVESKITSRTRAIMVVHLFGQCATWTRSGGSPSVMTFCYGGRGPIAGCGIPGKTGRQSRRHGVSQFLSDEEPRQLRRCRHGGHRRPGVGGADGLPARPRHGAAVPPQVSRLECTDRCASGGHAAREAAAPGTWISDRQAAAKRYDGLIEENHLTYFLERPRSRANRRHTFNQYVVRVAEGERDALVRHFKAERIGCEIYYPVPLHLQECLAYLGYGEGDFPASEQAARCVLALPIFPEITVEQQERVVQSVATFLRKRSRLAA